MNTTHDAVVGRRSFLRRTAGITAGAAAFVAAGLNTPTTLAAPVPSPAAVTEAIGGLSIELFDVTGNRTLGRFTSSTNIGTESEIIEMKTVDKTGRTVIQKIPGRTRYLDVTLTRGITNDTTFTAWRSQVEAGDLRAARTVNVIVRDTMGEVVFQWRLDRAWPADLVAHDDESLIESLTIVCENVIRER